MVPVEGGYESFELEDGLQPISSFEQFIDQALEEGRDEGREFPPLPASRPWVGRVPEEDLGRWLDRLSERHDVRVACPNWRLSLASFPPAAEVVEFDWRGAADFLAATCRPWLSHPTRTGEGIHVAVVDSGVSPQAMPCCPAALNRPQLDVASFGSCWRSDPYDDAGHGSLVAAIIHQLAPWARVTSVRCTSGANGLLAPLVYGLLATPALSGPLDVVNLSLSAGSGVQVCPYCEAELYGMDPTNQLEAVFDYLMAMMDPCPLFVAAGGTQSRLALPAALPGVIGVGSIEVAEARAPDPVYDQVGRNFVVAAGGSAANPIRSGPNASQYGSSFATAVVTGLLAQDRSGALARNEIAASGEARVTGQERLLAGYAETGFPGYDPAVHGLGRLS